jgi:hypothetical protein
MSGWLGGDEHQWGGHPIARSLADARPRRRVASTGTVTKVTVAIRGSSPAFEAELDGLLTLRWLGRERVPGIEPGAVVHVEGVVMDDHGRLVIVNPLYELTVDPDGPEDSGATGSSTSS